MNSNCEAPTQQQNLPFRSEIESNIQPYLTQITLTRSHRIQLGAPSPHRHQIPNY